MRKRCFIYITGAVLLALLAGCGSAKEVPEDAESLRQEEMADAAEKTDDALEKTGIAGETAEDGHIDFAALQEENPDIFAWLYVPGTDIDAPILQSPISDDYYISHTADGKEEGSGALYTEMPNMMDMCDFNTVIHGNDREEDSLFADLHKFEEPGFFKEHEKFYIYLPDNVLTYEIFAAYYDEDSDILRRYDYTTYEGCQEYLKQIYGLRTMSKNQREGWEDLTPYHFLATLNGSIREDEERQYVVTGVLIDDAAGKIDRVILD